MKSNYPDTPLKAVNFQAAKLLANTEEPPDQTGFYLDLLEEAERLNKDILSMQNQLAAYKGEPNEWHRHCVYSLQRAKMNLAMIQESIRAVTYMSNNMRKMKRREEAHKKELEFKKAALEAKVRLAQINREKHLERIELEKKAKLEELKAREEAEIAKRRLLVEQGRAFDSYFRHATMKTVGKTVFQEIFRKAKEMEETNETTQRS